MVKIFKSRLNRSFRRKPIQRYPHQRYQKSQFHKKAIQNYAVLKNDPKYYAITRLEQIFSADQNYGMELTYTIPQGDRDNTRQGNRIFVKSISYRIRIHLEDCQSVRLVMFNNKNNLPVIPSAPLTALSLQDCISYGGSFQPLNVVFDKTITIPQQTASSSDREWFYEFNYPVNQYWNYQDNTQQAPINAPGANQLIFRANKIDGGSYLQLSYRVNYTD